MPYHTLNGNDNLDHTTINHIAKICARRLSKLKLLQYCSKYYSAGPIKKKFDEYNFKINYYNTKDNDKLSNLLIDNTYVHL